MAYDDWLVAPYEEAAERADAFTDFCEAHDLDPDDPGAEDAFDAHLEAAAEEAELARSEARLDARRERAYV